MIISYLPLEINVDIAASTEKLLSISREADRVNRNLTIGMSRFRAAVLDRSEETVKSIRLEIIELTEMTLDLIRQSAEIEVNTNHAMTLELLKKLKSFK